MSHKALWEYIWMNICEIIELYRVKKNKKRFPSIWLVSCPRKRRVCRARHGLEHLRLGVDLGHDGVGQVLRVHLPLQEVRDQLVARLAAAVRQALGPG